MTSRNPLPVRSPLDLLQLEFPRYRIRMQTIGDELFYIAEAARPEVQPSFVQAQTAERLRSKLSVPVKAFTTAQPSIARVWDVLLAGTWTACRMAATWWCPLVSSKARWE